MTDVDRNARDLRLREKLESKLIEVTDDLDDVRQGDGHPDWKKQQEEAIGSIMAQLTSALGRIEDGSFGMCTSCGQPIAEGQLTNLPWLGECMACSPPPDMDVKTEPKKKTGILERARRRMGLKEDGSEDGVVEASTKDLMQKFNEAAADVPGDEWSPPVPDETIAAAKSLVEAGGGSADEVDRVLEGAGAKQFADDPIPQTQKGQVRDVPIDKIRPAPDNDRESMDEEKLKELGEAIIGVGTLLQRIALTPIEGTDEFEIIDGHRRHAALKKLGWEFAPSEIFDRFTAAQMHAARFIANLQRDDLTPLEEAKALSRLINEHGYSQRELSRTIGMSQPVMSKRLALLSLTDRARDMLQKDVITQTEALELLKLKDHPKKLDEVLNMRVEYNYDIAGTVKREVGDLDRRAKLDKAKKDLEKDGVTVYGQSKYSQMSGKADLGKRPGQLDIDKKKHAAEPCHAATIDEYSQRTILFCTEWERHRAKAGASELKGKLVAQPKGPQLPGLSVEEKERREQLRAAHTNRETFVKDVLLKGGKAGTGEALQLFMCMLTSNPWDCYFDADEAAHALGVVGDKRAVALAGWVGADTDKALKVLLAETIRNIDYDLEEPESWVPELQPYFDFLVKHGYELSPIEREQLQPKEDKKSKGAG